MAKVKSVKTAIAEHGRIALAGEIRETQIEILAAKLTEAEIHDAIFQLYLSLEFAEEADEILPIAADLDLMCDVLAAKTEGNK